MEHELELWEGGELVGTLCHDGDQYIWEYAGGGGGATHVLLSFPDVGRIYRSASLPAFFENRVVRPSQQWAWKQVGRSHGPTEGPEFVFEQLKRTGGIRMTDSYVMK